MNHSTIEYEILEMINCIVEGKYIGGLSVFNEDDYWELRLYFHVPEAPMILSYQGKENEFKEFIANEIRTRKLEKYPRWEINVEYPALICKDDEWVLETDNIYI